MRSHRLFSAFVFCLAAASSKAATYYLGASFGSSTNTLTTPYHGTATLSYEAPTPLADGSYEWDSFTNLQLTIVFGEVNFSLEHLLTPTDEISIEVRSGGFFFGRIPEYEGGDPSVGAADFENGLSELSTAPMPAGDLSTLGSHYHFDSPSGPDLAPVLYYAPTPVPEPSIALLTAGAVAIFARRRR